MLAKLSFVKLFPSTQDYLDVEIFKDKFAAFYPHSEAGNWGEIHDVGHCGREAGGVGDRYE